MDCGKHRETVVWPVLFEGWALSRAGHQTLHIQNGKLSNQSIIFPKWEYNVTVIYFRKMIMKAGVSKKHHERFANWFFRHFPGFVIFHENAAGRRMRFFRLGKIGWCAQIIGTSDYFFVFKNDLLICSTRQALHWLEKERFECTGSGCSEKGNQPFFYGWNMTDAHFQRLYHGVSLISTHLPLFSGFPQALIPA